MNSLGFPENVFNVTHRKTNKITNSDQFCLYIGTNDKELNYLTTKPLTEKYSQLKPLPPELTILSPALTQL